MLSPATAIKAESTTLRRAGGVGALPYRRCSTGNVRGSPIGSLRGVGIVVVPVQQPFQTPAHRRLFLNVVIRLYTYPPLSRYSDSKRQMLHSRNNSVHCRARNPIQLTARLGSSYKIYPAVITTIAQRSPRTTTFRVLLQDDLRMIPPHGGRERTLPRPPQDRSPTATSRPVSSIASADEAEAAAATIPT